MPRPSQINGEHARIYVQPGQNYVFQNGTTRCGNFTAAGCRYAVEIGLRRSLYVNGLCKPPKSSGVRQVFRAERPKPQPPHVYYYYHQNFAYLWIALLSRVNQE